MQIGDTVLIVEKKNFCALHRQINGKYVRRKTPQYKLDEARALLINGASVKKVSRDVGLALSTVRRVRDDVKTI